VNVLFRQLLGDIRAHQGDNVGACEALLRAVTTGPGLADPKRLPLMIGWAGLFDCGYCKAQQSVRFGRLALLSAKGSASAIEHMEETTPELRKIRIAKFKETQIEAAAKARRHLLEARGLYDSEMAQVDGLFESTSCTGPEADEWRLVLSCARLGTVDLLGEALLLEGRHADAKSSFDEAIRDAARLQNDPCSTPHLQRLLARKREVRQANNVQQAT